MLENYLVLVFVQRFAIFYFPNVFNNVIVFRHYWGTSEYPLRHCTVRRVLGPPRPGLEFISDFTWYAQSLVHNCI